MLKKLSKRIKDNPLLFKQSANEIRKVNRGESLEELVERINDNNTHEHIETKRRGKEIW